jgi:hypothetical protein
MTYCETCGNVHAHTGQPFRERNEKAVSLERLRDQDGRYHNECCALIESLAYFITGPFGEEH